LGLTFPITLVLFLDLFNLRLNDLEISLALDLLYEKRDKQNTNQDNEHDNGKTPGPAAVWGEDFGG
jgi:hypothetical protein